MDSHEIIRAAIPGADDALCSHVLWGRTCFPFGEVTPRDLYRAASRLRRASAKGLQFCDFCNRLEQPGRWLCAQCESALCLAGASYGKSDDA